MNRCQAVLFLSLLFIYIPAVSAEVLYVPQDYATIQDAVDAVHYSWDVIFISPGIYTGEGNRDIELNGINVEILGDGQPEEIILDANASAEDPHRVFLMEGHGWEEIKLRNLTIQNALIDGPSQNGGAIQATDVYLDVRNCRFINNKAICREAGHGGAINFSGSGVMYCTDTLFKENHARNSGGAVRAHNCFLIQCEITGNTGLGAGGASVTGYSIIDSCIFRENRSTGYRSGGGALRTSAGHLIIRNSLFNNNSAYTYGGAVDVQEATHVELDSNIFRNNSAFIGGAIMINGVSGDVRINNCEISGNRAGSEGAGLHLNSCVGEITHCTFTENIAEDQGGGIWMFDIRYLNVSNSIFYENDAPVGAEVYGTDRHAPGRAIDMKIEHSVFSMDKTYIEGENCEITPGESLINGSPEFLDPSNGDYHLNLYSPCIDTGNPETSSPYDLDDISRPVGKGPDMGAYEFPTFYDTGVHLILDKNIVTEGDLFRLQALAIPETQQQEDAVFVLALEVGSSLLFYPQWQPDINLEPIMFENGRWWDEILSFYWPADVGSGSGCFFHAAILKPDDVSLIGNLSTVPFGYY